MTLSRIALRRAALRRVVKAILLAALAAALAGACTTLDFQAPESAEPFPAYPETSFAVFSDPHLFPPELGIGQPAFQKIARDDRKLYAYSGGLLDVVTEKIIAARPRFVIVPGDLTKDGEEASHLAFARAMEKFRAAGVAVYVVPGNHDVHNPRAVRYEGDREIRAAGVSAERFAEIYRDCGYGAALERDPQSLSYLAEPEPGLLLLALDSCRHDLSRKDGREHAEGSFTAERLSWIRGILERGRREGKAMIAAMHHGVVEHFPGQKKQFPQFVVGDDQAFSRLLAAYGVRVVFTGHFHAQNVAGAWWNEGGVPSSPPARRFVFDVETGSLVTYPLPYRLIRIGADQVMRVRSYRIDSLPETPAGLVEYSRQYAREGMVPYISGAVAGYGVSREDAGRIAEAVADAALAHFAGDPRFDGKEMYPTENLGLAAWIGIMMKKDVIEGMWRGNPPHADNDIDINLADGTY